MRVGVHPNEYLDAGDGRASDAARGIDWRLVAIIWILATAWGMFYLTAKGFLTRPPLPGHEEPEIAMHVAAGHGFRSPFDRSLNAPMTSWSPPLYVYLMAGVFK